MGKKNYNNGKNSPKYIELTNKRFGKLVARDYILHETKHGNQKWMWLCDCDCGDQVKARTNELTKGVKTQCKNCSVKEQAEKRILENNGALVNRIYKDYQRGAKDRGLTFDLTKEEFEDLIFGECYYCGSTPKRYDGNVKYERTGEFKRNGIDRIDSTIGYVNSNLRTCCDTCNIAKHANSEDDFIDWVIKVYNHLNLEERSTTIPLGSTEQANGSGNGFNPIL